MSTAPHRVPWVTLALGVAVVVAANCLAQEVASIDLTQIRARTDLRRPKLTQGASGSRSGIHEIHVCSNRGNTFGTLQTTLLSLDRTHYIVGDKPKFELAIENLGSTRIRLPISPHLSDLQPKDPSQKFNYSELQVVLWIAGTDWSANLSGHPNPANDGHLKTGQRELIPGR
jgi:hypothetical protein